MIDSKAIIVPILFGSLVIIGLLAVVLRQLMKRKKAARFSPD